VAFWDRFVLALYFGLAQRLPAGRGAALRILDAIARGRLSLSSLNDTSLVLLLALLPEGSPHRREVVSRLGPPRLTLAPPQLISVLRNVAPPRLAELVEIARPPGPQVRAAALNALMATNLGLIEGLALYLCRLFLFDPSHPALRNLVARLIVEATQRYVRIPLGTMDYLTWGYRVVRVRTRSPEMPLPSGFPPGPRPAWFMALSPEEQRFIDDCLHYLPEPAVDLLYLHFYALLNVEQIVGALHLVRPHGAADAVVRRLEESWGVIL
jgi:hypothetical protein